MTVYPLATTPKLQETLEALETSRLSSRKVGLLTQLVIAAGTSVPLPPSVAPVLIVNSTLGSFVAELDWTASNRTGLPGFAYQIWVSLDGGAYSLLDTVGAATLSYSHNPDPTAGTYSYYIKPINDAGEGPSSNAAITVLPGECDAPVLTGPTPPTQPAAYQLTWTVPDGALFDSYRIYLALDEIGPYNLEATIEAEPNPSYLAGTSGWWKVAAYESTTTTEGPLSNAVYGEIVIPTVFTYLRPGGVDTYFRPDGTSIYIRP